MLEVLSEEEEKEESLNNDNEDFIYINNEQPHAPILNRQNRNNIKNFNLDIKS